jgi:hypothetical protein
MWPLTVTLCCAQAAGPQKSAVRHNASNIIFLIPFMLDGIWDFILACKDTENVYI